MSAQDQAAKMSAMEWLVEMAVKYTWRFAVAMVLIFAAAGSLVWYQAVWQSPGKVFEDMLANNLSATSVTKQLAAAGAGQSLDQTVRLRLGSSNIADWLIIAGQGNASITTENIATPDASYVRYVKIAAKDGKPVAAPDLLNQWGKSDGKTDTDLSQLFAGALLDIQSAPLPPIGNLPAERRENLLAYIRDNKVFTPDYSKVKTGVVNGHGVYTYPVAVSLSAYVVLMQTFAHDLGLSQLDQLDANQYISAEPIAVTLSVDRQSHQLVQAAYAGSGFTQTYTDWGLETAIAPPVHVVTTTELQKRLQAVVKG